MNIKVCNKTKTAEFSSIKMGDIFIYDSKLFMKVQPCLDPFDDLKYNAVEMEHGYLVLFPEDEITEPLQGAELTVWR